MNEKKKEINEKLKEIVLIRIEAMPQNYKLSVGNEGVFSKEDLIKHVSQMDSIGKQIVESEHRFLKALSVGEVTKALTST